MKKDKNLIYGLADKFQSDLLRERVVSDEQLTHALATKARTRLPLGAVLIKEKYLSEEQYVTFIARRLQLSYVDVESYTVDPEVLAMVPVELARKYDFIPLYQVENIVTIAISDPINVLILDKVRGVINTDLDLVISTSENISKAISNNYGDDDQLEMNLDELETVEELNTVKVKEEEAEDILAHKAEQPGVVKMVNSIIWQALKERASDIHIDPSREHGVLRFRIDGIVREITRISNRLFVPMVSRIKVMADLDISQSRIPQDGAVRLVAGNREVELRIATYPTIHKEAVTIRILTRQNAIASLPELGLTKKTLTGVNSLLRKRHGLFLVTGPTGSGKSTTLYTALGMLNSSERHIISIEDPVEIGMKGVNQAQINVKAGLTFAAALRSMLRHDPDVILVGEIRDQETAQLAIRAAVTGHLVFSSLHTNDALSSIGRLINLNVDPFLLATAMEGILNQRLVRVICPSCKYQYAASKEELGQLGVQSPGKEVLLARGKGCSKCNQTGFHGRIGLYEWLSITDEIREFVLQRAANGASGGIQLNTGGDSLRADGFEKVLHGITAIDEVLEVVA